MSTVKCFWKVDKEFFHVSAAKFNVYYLLIKFESTEEFNLKSSYIYSINYDYVYPLIKLDPTEKFKLE